MENLISEKKNEAYSKFVGLFYELYDYPQSYHQLFLSKAWWYDFSLVSLHSHF